MVAPCIPPFIRDALLISFYNDLKGKLSTCNPGYPNADLDSLILDHAHFHNGKTITMIGGEHDVLFYLKSLDLDLRLGYQLGTVCGYGWDKCNEVDAEDDTGGAKCGQKS
jgi:hypothetical protein